MGARLVVGLEVLGGVDREDVLVVVPLLEPDEPQAPSETASAIPPAARTNRRMSESFRRLPQPNANRSCG